MRLSKRKVRGALCVLVSDRDGNESFTSQIMKCDVSADRSTSAAQQRPGTGPGFQRQVKSENQSILIETYPSTEV